MKNQIPYVRNLREELIRAVARTGPGGAAPKSRLHWSLTGAVFLTMVAGGLAGLILLPNGAESNPGGAPPRQAPVPSRGGEARCVEDFNLVNLAGRDFAFDGTITAVIPPRDVEAEGPAAASEVVFEVHLWYKGGSGSMATLKTYEGAPRPGELAELPLEPGTRILASGDGEFLWSCGFSVPYDAEVAGLFEKTFAQE